MCGISISFPGNLFKKNQILEVVPRGSSINEIVVDEFCLLHQLLSTTRSDNCPSIQPSIINGDSFLLFNGLITNTKELSIKHKIVDFEGDTELLLKCLKIYGNKILYELKGSFVICIVNTKNRQVTVFRDFSGSRPLYYNIQNSMIKLHSDPRAIVDKDFNAIDIVSNSYQLFGFVPEQLFYSENKSMLRSFKPGVITTLIKGNVGWTIHEDQNVLLASQCCDEEGLLANVVKSFCIGTDVLPTSVFLSGGVDSSLLAYFLRDKGINTITVASKVSNEIRRAREWSCKLSLKNISHLYGDDEVTKIISEKQKRLPFKSKDGSNILAATFLAEKAKSRIVFSGAGLDEVSNGYNQIRKIYIINKMISTKSMRRISQFFGYSFVSNGYFRLGSEDVQSYLASRLWTKKKEISDKEAEILELISVELIDEVVRWKKSFADMSQKDRLLLYDYIFYTRNQLMRESDVLGYAQKIEIRVPFCEPNFVISMMKRKLRNKRLFRNILVKKGWIKAPKEGFFFG
jgi:asparagine synthetase B (glutamine-hydrolysing)